MRYALIFDTQQEYDAAVATMGQTPASTLTLQDVRQAVVDAVGREKSGQLKELLANYNVKKASDLYESDWQEFVNKCENL